MTILNVLHDQHQRSVEVPDDMSMGVVARRVAFLLGISPDWPGLLLVNSHGDEIPSEARAEVYDGHTVGLRTRETLTHSRAIIESRRNK